jgi:hypothetical protein
MGTIVESRPTGSILDNKPDNLQVTVLKRIGKCNHRIEHIVVTHRELLIREVLTFLFHRDTAKRKSTRGLSRKTADTDGDQESRLRRRIFVS